MADSRSKNSRRNILSGIIMQVINIILPFVVRTIILYILGAEYQGLNSLFTSILSVLNLADLGFSSAVIFALYKPIAEGNDELVSAIMNYLKKIYYIVGAVILVAGCAIMPFLTNLISGDIPADTNIYILFAFFLLGSVVSYWLFAYKSALFIAMQRKDVNNIISTIANVMIKGIQIVLLLAFKNFYFYVVCIPVGAILNNVLLEVYSRKFFPNIIPSGHVDSETKKMLSKQVKAVCIDKVCDVARNSFDHVVISSLLGLTAVAVFSNYYYVFSSLYGIMLVVNSAIQASVGNSIAKESVDKNQKDFVKLTFITMWITGVFSICMLCVFQDFMIAWTKNIELVLPILCVILFVIYFYFLNANNTRNLYLEGNGLFWKCKYLYIGEALMNLGLDILLCYFFGIPGIIIATISSIFVFNFILRSIVLFRNYFVHGLGKFFLSHFVYLVVASAVGVGLYYLLDLIKIDNSIVSFLVKGIICFISVNVAFLIVYFKTSIFKESLSFGLKLFNKNKA